MELWALAGPGPVSLEPGLLPSECVRPGGGARILFVCWAVLWGLLAAALSAHPYSHHLESPGLPGSGSWGLTRCTCSSTGELGGEASPRVVRV